MDYRKALAELSPLGEYDPDGRYLSRELSWLEFNLRVLHQAVDPRTPLLERMRFMAIFNSNLDEFFQKRVGGLKRQIAANLVTRTPDGLSPAETCAQIRRAVLRMLDLQARVFTEDIRPALSEHGIDLLQWHELSEQEQAAASDYFHRNLFPVLTPLAVDPGHPFPFISNLSTSLGIMLRQPGRAAGERHFARIKIPHVLPRWVRIDTAPVRSREDDHPLRFVHMRDVIQHRLSELFEGMQIEDVMAFRITRNAAVEREDEDAEDLLELIEQELRDRKFAPVVRLEVGPDANADMVQFLARELELEDSDIYHMPAELDYTDLDVIADIQKPELKYPAWTPAVPARLRDDEADIFTVIRGGDLLLHHPYDSFTASVERFLRAAVADPRVLAIKQTLYRTSSDSPFIPELIRAAEAGKQVICLIELKARFDEERNIRVAQTLVKAGVHVVYGLVGLKTHTKLAMAVRHESDGMRTYCHIGTGNYNSKTASLYTDLGLMTCRPDIVGDAVELFHYLTGRSLKRDFRRLLVAPVNMRRRFVEMIDREVAHCDDWRRRGGEPDDPDRPRVIAKMNSLEDRDLCDKLYAASNAGVHIDLIVRGFCCLRPGVPGMSENIRVISIIGRFLEHSRIFIFHNAGQREYYIGSADWMYRNLNNRVECITPVDDPTLQERLQQIVDICLADHRQAWDMRPDGRYTQRQPLPTEGPDAVDPEDHPAAVLGTQQALMELTRADTVRV